MNPRNEMHIVQSWCKNATAWTQAVRAEQNESRYEFTDLWTLLQRPRVPFHNELFIEKKYHADIPITC